MRPELEEIQYIEDYLFDKLSKDQKNEFEHRVVIDTEFAQKVEVQRLLISRIKHISIKQAVAKAHKTYIHNQNFPFNLGNPGNIFVSILALSLLTTIAFFVFKSDENISTKSDKQQVETFKLPIKGVDVPYITKNFNADSGAILHYTTGSLVRIPAGAFLNENYKPVHGIVELKFREFPDIADIFIAGIPMGFQLRDNQTLLESFAMSEIYAFQDNKAIRIMEGKKIEIVQKSNTMSTSINLYQFDKEKRNWIEKGKDWPVNLQINIEGDKDEAFIHDGIEILKKQNNHLKDSSGYSFEAQKRAIANKINKKRLIVLELSKSNIGIEKLISIDPVDDELIKNEETIDQLYVKALQAFDILEDTKETIRRTYCIEMFGLWNCDQPINRAREKVYAQFQLNNKKTEFESVALAVSEMRTIIDFNLSNKAEFGYYPGYANTFWTILEGNKLAYFEKFDKLPFSKNSKQFTFKMKVYPVALNNYEQARKAINSLFK